MICWDLIRGGGGGAPITAIASLCARRLLPAGAEREKDGEERGQNREKANDEWMESVQGQRSEKKGSKGEHSHTAMMWLCKRKKQHKKQMECNNFLKIRREKILKKQN